MKFEFNQDKAAEIAALYNLPKSVVTVWKTRNSIPSKYFDTDGVIRKDVDTSENISDADKYRLLQVLETNHLHLSKFASLTLSEIQDLKRGKATISVNKYKSVKVELVQLKNKFDAVIAAKTITAKCRELKKLFEHPLLKPFTFAEGREAKYAIEVILKGDESSNIELIEQIIINCSLFKQSIIL